MANEIENKEPFETTFKANGEDITLKPSTVANYLTEGKGQITKQEVVMFINLCKYQHLNPFLKEAYLIKFGDQPASIITSKEAFMKRANSDAHYKGFKAGIVVARGDEMKYLKGALMMPNDQLIGGWADVYRDDREEPIHIEVAFDEFAKYKKDGSLQATWANMGKTMIRKTALVNALREAFPDSLGSLYTEDDKQPKGTTPAKAEEQKPERKSVDSIIKKPAKKVESVNESDSNANQAPKPAATHSSEESSETDPAIAHAVQRAEQEQKEGEVDGAQESLNLEYPDAK